MVASTGYTNFKGNDSIQGKLKDTLGPDRDRFVINTQKEKAYDTGGTV